MNWIKYTLIFCCLTLGSLSRSEMRVLLRAEGLSFISPDYENTEQKTFGFFGASLLPDSKKTDIVIVNLTGLYAAGQPALSYLNIRELYFNYQIDASSKFYFGRKINNWSQLDSEWNIGFFNPQFRWNALAPEHQGLTGLFWDKKQAMWELSLFASPFYIPDQGPGYELKDGKFQNSNPFFSSPPQNVSFQNGVILPIDYELEKPETSEVVFQTLYGAQLHLGEKQGFFANVSGMHKPANQLSLGYKVVGVVDRVRINVLPKVYTETNLAADLGYRDDWGALNFSVLHSNPKAAAYDAGFNAPEFEESLSYGPQLSLDLKPFSIQMAYLDTTGGDVKDIGPDASSDRQALSQRFLFRQAFQIQLSHADVFLNSFRLDTSFQYRQSEKDEFKQIRFKQRLNIRGPWAFWIDALLIETAEETSSNMEPYRNLDQVFLGVTYDI